MLSYFPMCFAILTISLCFLECHLWEFSEACVKAVFLQRRLFSFAN